jgi:acyl carrier protein
LPGRIVKKLTDMLLPKEAHDFLNENARRLGVPALQPTEDLFALGVLDSFALVDFIGVLEQACNIRVPDSDVSVPNFQTLETIEGYLEKHRG